MRSSSLCFPNESARILLEEGFGMQKTSSPEIMSQTRIVFVPAVAIQYKPLHASMMVTHSWCFNLLASVQESACQTTMVPEPTSVTKYDPMQIIFVANSSFPMVSRAMQSSQPSEDIPVIERVLACV